MVNFKYELAKKGKSFCPVCGKKSFVLYIDTSSGEPLHTTVGKCDRSDHCGNHKSPKAYFKDNNISFDRKTDFSPNMAYTAKPKQKPQPSFIDEATFRRSLAGYEQNNFVKWLSGIVGAESADEAIKRYHAGTSKDGGTVFWQVDLQERIRTGKIIHYADDGHRRKDVSINWVHNILKLPDFNLRQCLFGEHLLLDTAKTVAIVESEKTAVIASIYQPDMVWLASGGSEGLNADKCAVLRGRNVILYPDCCQFDKWNSKAKELLKRYSISVSVSDMVERCATDAERKAGIDIADYLIRYNPDDFLKREQPVILSIKEKSNRLNELNEKAATPVQTIFDDAGRKEFNTRIAQSKANPKQSPAYVTDSGILYIPTPPDRRSTYTVYQSVTDYNNRLKIPEIVYFDTVDVSGMRQVDIDMDTLTVAI